MVVAVVAGVAVVVVLCRRCQRPPESCTRCWSQAIIINYTGGEIGSSPSRLPIPLELVSS